MARNMSDQIPETGICVSLFSLLCFILLVQVKALVVVFPFLAVWVIEIRRVGAVTALLTYFFFWSHCLPCLGP